MPRRKVRVEQNRADRFSAPLEARARYTLDNSGRKNMGREFEGEETDPLAKSRTKRKRKREDA